MVLLDDQNDRNLVGVDLARICGCRFLVEILQSVGEADRRAARIEMPHADDMLAAVLLSGLGLAGVPSDKSLVYPGLGLVAQVVVYARNDDDQPVAGVGGLADQSGIVGRFPALYMANDHAATIPWDFFFRVSQTAEYLVGDLVCRDHDILR